MFHRVKSETQSSPSKSDTASSEKAAPVQNKTEAQTSSSQEASPPAQAKSATTPSPAKTQSYLQISNADASDESSTPKDASEQTSPTSTQPKTSSLTQKKDPKTMSNPSPYTPNEMPTDAERSSEAPAATYQRPSVTPGYAPSYSSPYAKVNTPANAALTENDSKLTIGRGITMSGEIESCDHLYVEGTVEAALKGAQMLDVAESGVFYGSVEIQEAVISGRFEGELNVTGRLTIESTGIVTGTISYGELQLEAGAIVDGRMTPLGAQKDAATSPSAANEASAEKATNADLLDDAMSAS